MTAAVIIEDGRILLARRPLGDPLEGMWEMPGGKIEAGESPQQCLERELLEELAMTAKAGAVLARTVYHYSHGSFEMLAVAAMRLSGYRLHVHDQVRWVQPDGLQQLRVAPADVELLDALANAGRL